MEMANLEARDESHVYNTVRSQVQEQCSYNHALVQLLASCE